MAVSKRQFLRNGAYAVAASTLAPHTALAAALLEPTPPMALGPFYPVQKPLEDDADMTRLAGHKQRAKGPLIELTGRVLDVNGHPVAAAEVQVWQADAAGRYSHHGDDNPAPLDPDFQYYAVQKTDADGRFRFLTVKPGAYPAGHYMRSPHIHFDVAGKYDRLITQMYFPGEHWLTQDKTLLHDIYDHTNPMPAQIFGKLTPGGSKLDAAATLCQYDVVLWDG